MAPNPKGHKDCIGFPDIYTPFPPGSTEEQKTEINKANESRATLYRAVRFILTRDFAFSKDIPHDPKNFPGNLDEPEIANFLAVLGLLLLDNFNDPTLAKQSPTGDDVDTVDEEDKKTPIIIARRFVDAIVSAVQEYSARGALFQKIYGFIKQDAQQAAA